MSTTYCDLVTSFPLRKMYPPLLLYTISVPEVQNGVVVSLRDTPHTAAPYNQPPRHIIAFPVAAAPRGSPRREGSAHERDSADAPAPGPARARGGCEPGVQHRCLGAEEPGCSDRGGIGRWDSGR